MASKFGTWGRKIKHHPFIAMGTLVLFIVFLTFALAVHWFGWDWTGFTGYSSPTPQYQREKTLWDWLQLLVVPLMLAIGGFWFNQIQKDREQRAIDERAEREKRETEQRAKTERESAEQRDRTEREIAVDNQREAALQAYLDKMSELLLEKKLRDSAEEDELRKIARVRTLTILSRLDANRKRSVLQFLHESGLIRKNKCIIDLNGANLSGAYLRGAFLSGAVPIDADLNDAARSELAFYIAANLSYADLHGADLHGADLHGADLHGADLNRADLSDANLNRADLHGADLNRADLSDANLNWADLSGANLKDTIGVTVEKLEKHTASLQGATMPDGSKYP